MLEDPAISVRVVPFLDAVFLGRLEIALLDLPLCHPLLRVTRWFGGDVAGRAADFAPAVAIIIP